MFSRLVVALVTGPVWGILATLAVIPLSVAMGVFVFLLASVGGTADEPGAVVAAFFILIATLIVSLAIAILVTVQMARYAASFSGAKRLSEQPPFMTAFWRGVVMMILYVIFSVLLGVTVSVLFASFWAETGLTQMDASRILDWTNRFEAYTAGSDPGDVDTSAFDYVILGYQAYSWITIMVLAMLMIPRVCGFGLESAKVWSAGYLALRFFVVIPCCAAVLAVFAAAVAWGLGAFVPGESGGLERMVFFAIQTTFITGAAFAAEAMLLAAARDYGVERREALVALERANPRDFRAILAERMNDGE